MDRQAKLKQKTVLRRNNEESNAFTKECVETALIELMKSKSFEEITITDITKKAGVSRNAYYRNYSSKEDILSAYLQSLIAEITIVLKQHNPIRETRESWLSLLTIVKQFYPQYKLLINAGYAQNIMIEMQKVMNKTTEQTNSALYYSNAYWAGAITSILTSWVKNGMDVSIEELAEIGCQLMQKGIGTITLFGNRC